MTSPFQPRAFRDAPNKKGGLPEDSRRSIAMLNVEKTTNEIKGKAVGTLFSAANVGDARRAHSWLTDRIQRSAHEGSFTETVLLTPVLAELLLQRNPDNRNVRERAVDTYVRDIKNGDWSFNGESIKVSVDGFLNDGQHRCHAVVKAGRSIKTNVTFGLERNSRLTVDQGAVRTAGNYLAMDGYKDGNNVAAVASFLWQFENIGRFSSGGNDRPTKAQVHQIAETHHGIDVSLKAVPNGNQKVASRSLLAFCHYVIARRAGSHAANAFILNLVLGGIEGRSNPINRVRDRLMSDKGRLTSFEKAELIFRGWNAYRKNRRMDKSVALQGEFPKLER